MATVTGMTAAAMQAIADNSIVEGIVSGGDLLLTTRGGTQINAGSVIGPTGAPGADGEDGTDGAVGPAGAVSLVGAPTTVTTVGPTLSNDGDLQLTRNNVPVVIGHTYGIWVDFMLQWASFDVDSRWDIWLRVNGVNYERYTVIQPLITGVSFQPVRGEIFWVAPATLATDDFTIWGDDVVDGALIEPAGSATLPRRMKITDYGVL